MLSLVNVVAILVRHRARASVALLCVWATLLVANLASAEARVQAKTRVWGFEEASALNVCSNALASIEQHRGIRSSSGEVASGPLLAARGAGRLTSIGSGQWRSSAGLVYGQGSVHGNRVRHVLAHAAPDASKPAHSVFNVARNRVLGLVDEAWAARGSHTIHRGSGNWNYRVDMGRVIGTEGQTAINISVRPGTSEIITAFPVP